MKLAGGAYGRGCGACSARRVAIMAGHDRAHVRTRVFMHVTVIVMNG